MAKTTTNKSRQKKSDLAITIAVPKGRILAPLSKRLASVGVQSQTLLDSNRKLVRTDSPTGVRFLLLKPDDVPTYVEYGAADLGIVGRDILLERNYDLYIPVTLPIGKCRLVVAGASTSFPQPKQGLKPLFERRRVIRVATKFPIATKQFFLNAGLQVEIIYLRGSVELAPSCGLADVIVDLVETGETLRENGLVELATIETIFSVVIANRVELKLKRAALQRILDALSNGRGLH